MIADIAMKIGRNSVKRTQRSVKGDIVVYSYHCNEELFATAKEVGNKEQGYARIVCKPDGTKATRLLTTQGGYTKGIVFGFSIDEEFVVIELQHEQIRISRVVLMREDILYQLICERIANLTPGNLSDFERFREAIEAGKKRLECPNCAHAHYAASNSHVESCPIEIEVIGRTHHDRPAFVMVPNIQPDGGGYILRYEARSSRYTTILAGEEGDAHARYAQIVCSEDGNRLDRAKTTGLGDRALPRFSFEPEETFTVVRLDNNTYSIWRVRLTSGHTVRLEPVAKYETVGILSEGPFPRIAPYWDALKAAYLRLNCHRCDHTHFVR